MTLDEARHILNTRSGTMHDAAAAAAFVCSFYSSDEGRHLTRPAIFTTDAKRHETSRQCVERLAAEWRSGVTKDAAYYTTAAPRRAGRHAENVTLAGTEGTREMDLMLQKSDGLSEAERRSIRVADERRCRDGLRWINQQNRAFWAKNQEVSR